MRDAIVFWLVVETIGLAGLPLAAFFFARLPGFGLTLTRPLALLVFAYPAWLLANIEVVPLGRASVPLGAVVLVAAGAVSIRPAVAGLRRREALRLWLVGEVLFAVAFFGWALFRSFAPDVWNTEKPMDMAFVNAIQRAEWLPPHDPWLAGESLNYYYYGHYLVALLARASGVPPDVAFNLGVALFFALVACAVFGLVATISLALGRGRGVARATGFGLVAVGITLLLGNLAGATGLLGDLRPLAEYDWWSPSRVIDGTANEFPFFSFLLGDLHAHVMATPFALVAVGLALQLALRGPRLPRQGRLAAGAELVLAALLLGSVLATNTLDFPTAMFLVAAGLGLWLLSGAGSGHAAAAVAWFGLLLGGALGLFAPFLASFSPAAHGIELVREHEPFTRFAADLVLLYALPLWVLAAALAWRISFPARFVIWGGTALLVLLVLLAPSRLAGLFVVLALAAAAVHAALDPRLPQPERFFWLLVATGFALVAVGDFVYIRDSFEGTSSFRFNTVFKTGYQAWFLLSIAAAVGLELAGGWLRQRGLRLWQAGFAVCVLLLAVYPVAASFSRTDGFSRTPTLSGVRWLERAAPGDAAAIAWLRRSAVGAPVVLEAAGPDFSPDGYARVSTFTGLPTVIGWAGHEVQWGHDPASRAADVETIYATPDLARARRLLERYRVRYVFVGSLERARYPRRALAKFDHIGKPVFRRNGTVVYSVVA